MGDQLISQEEAAKRIGEGVLIDLGGGWVMDVVDGSIRREDERFHKALVGDHPAGYTALYIMEEPKLTETGEVGRRVVGHVIVEKNANGYVRARENKGWDGKILELKPSSISKGELAGDDAEPVGYYLANPQRLSGFIAVYAVESDFPNEEGMAPDDFAAASEDGRALAALRKLGL